MIAPVSNFASVAFLNPSQWGGWEMLLVVIIVLILFGPKRLPALSRSIGKSIRDFKKGLQDVKDDIERAGDEMEEEEAKKQAAPADKTAEPVASPDGSESEPKPTDKPAS